MAASMTGNERRYPECLRSLEAKLVSLRRTRAHLTSGGATPPALPHDTLGVAFSGGGIRSATFCLGVLQVLAGHNVIRKIDFLSTVSGGGYCGGFLGRWFSRKAQSLAEAEAAADPEEKAPDPVAELQADLNVNDSPPLRWLRESGRYMSPTGPGDVWQTVAIYLRNLFSVHLVVGVAFAAVALAAWLVGQGAGRLVAQVGWSAYLPAFQPSPGQYMWWSPWILLPVGLWVLGAWPLAWAYWLVPETAGEGFRANRPLHSALLSFLLSGAGGAWLLATTPSDASPLFWVGWVLVTVALVSVITLIVWYVVWTLAARSAAAARNRLSSLLTGALAAGGVALLLALVGTLGRTVYAVGACQGWKATLLDPKTLPPVATVLAVVAAVRKFAPALGNTRASPRWKLPLNVILLVAAILVAAVVCTVFATATQALVWAGRAPTGDPGRTLIHYDAPQPATPGSACCGPSTPLRRHPEHATAEGSPELLLPSLAMLAALGLSYSFGRTFRFINLSSYHALYAARLTRAYLGSTNPRRQHDNKPVRDVDADDDIPFARYRPFEAGGPLHLINATINETVGGQSQVEYRDRKGVQLAIGPAGVSVGARHHAVWGEPTVAQTDDAVSKDAGTPSGSTAPRLMAIEPRGERAGASFHPLRSGHADSVAVEPQTLGEWMAISGAAFSTGLGSRTNLGGSFLLGLSNVRLGYWWDSAIEPIDRSPVPAGVKRSLSYRLSRLLPLQSYLACEFFGRFYGTLRRRWYLTDGGHFENTACYELIRRRIPRIVCCDCGADPDYTWEDLANFARKVRIDFNAEVAFIRGSEVDNPEWVPKRLRGRIRPVQDIGRPTESPSHGAPATRAHATIARVYYRDDRAQQEAFFHRRGPWGTTILFLKPSLSGDEPLDLREYWSANPRFPQESTLDQDFDEAQWESYRKLGEHIAAEFAHALQDGDLWPKDGRP